jgi:hypothetical protein
MRHVRQVFDLSSNPTIVRNWFVPKAPDIFSRKESHNPPPSNFLAYNDIWFTGICQEWGQHPETGASSWFQVSAINSTKQYDDKGRAINQNEFYAQPETDSCLQMHLPQNVAKEPVPEKIAQGKIACYFAPGDRTLAQNVGLELSGLRGVISERGDCQGLFSQNRTLYSSLDFEAVCL